MKKWIFFIDTWQSVGKWYSSSLQFWSHYTSKHVLLFLFKKLLSFQKFIPSSYFTVQLFRKCFFLKCFWTVWLKNVAGYFLHSVVKYMYVHFFFLLKYTSPLYQQLTFSRVILIFFICMQQERFSCTLFQSMAIRCLYIKLHMESMALIFH